MKKYLVSYFKNGIAKTDTVVLYKEEIEKLSIGEIGRELFSELKWREKSDVVLINFWEIGDET